MADTNDPTKLDNLHDAHTRSNRVKHVWQSPESRAGVAALMVIVIGVILVAILQKGMGIDNDATIVTLLLVPLLVYGIVSGRLLELTGPGGWSAKFAELEKKLAQTSEQVAGQQDKIDEAEGAAKNAVQLANMAAPASAMRVQTAAGSDDEIAALIDEYNRIRKTQSVSSTRTANMTAVVRRMIDIAPQATFDVPDYLASGNWGQRLAAYATLYARPNHQFLDQLVESVVDREDKPFGQYWGLQAVSRNLSLEGQQALSTDAISRLQALARKVSPGTDRAYVLRTILREIEG